MRCRGMMKPELGQPARVIFLPKSVGKVWASVGVSFFGPQNCGFPSGFPSKQKERATPTQQKKKNKT